MKRTLIVKIRRINDHWENLHTAVDPAGVGEVSILAAMPLLPPGIKAPQPGEKLVISFEFEEPMQETPGALLYRALLQMGILEARHEDGWRYLTPEFREKLEKLAK